MDAQDPEKVSAIWVKNLNSIINKMKNTQSSMNHMSPEDAVKLDIVELNKPEAQPEEELLSEVGLCRYLYHPSK